MIVAGLREGEQRTVWLFGKPYHWRRVKFTTDEASGAIWTTPCELHLKAGPSPLDIK